MNLAGVMDDLGAALETIPKLRVFPYWAKRIVPPAAVVQWPEPLTYDATYRRGSDRTTIPVTLLVGNIDARTSRDALAKYADGDGTHSVKAAIDGYAATAYDTATVLSAEFLVIPVADVEYLAARFDVDISGSGSS